MARPTFGSIQLDDEGNPYVLQGDDPSVASNWVPMPAADRARRFASEVLQGATFNLGDEIAMGIAALPASVATGHPYGDVFADMMSQHTAEQEAYRQAMGGEALGATVLGALTTGGLGAARAAPALARAPLTPVQRGLTMAGATVGTGAAGGAVGGFGGATGSVEERLPEAAQGAAIGAGLGAAGAAALPVVRGVGRWVSPKRRAEAALRRNVPPETTVVAPEQTLAEAAGESGEFMLQGVATLPGRTRQAATDLLDQRQMMEHARVTDLLQRIGRQNPEEYLDDLERLYRQRGEEAAELYGTAFSGVPVNNTRPFLRQLLDDMPDSVARGWKTAQEIARAAPDQRPLPEVFQFSDDGERVVGILREPDLEAWHHIHMGLREVANSNSEMLQTGRRAFTSLGRAQEKTRKALQEELFEQFPDYETATRSYATYSQQIDAANRGRAFFNEKPDQVARYVDSLPDPAKEAYTMGMVRGMQDLADRADDVQDSARRVLRSQRVRKMIRSVLGERDGNELIQNLELESGFSQGRRRILGGSQTAQRLQAQQGLTPSNPLTSMGSGSGLADRLMGYQRMRNIAGEQLLQQGPAAQAAADALQMSPAVYSNPFWGLQSGILGGNLAN